MGSARTLLPAWLVHDLIRLAVTFTMALSVGWSFMQIGIPAPYLMGSLFGVWFGGALVRPLQPHLGVARWFHKPVVLGLGVLIGATFNQSVLDHADKWMVTLATMVGTTIVVTAIGYTFLRRRRGYEPRLAILCSVPGGQAEAIVMAREMVDKDYVVALFHLVRVVVVFVSTPLLLGIIEGRAAVENSNVALRDMPSIFGLPPSDIMVFVGLGVAGFIIARLCRVPMPHLLGPVGLSTLFHLTGWAELPRVNEFVILAQLAIGGEVGARLARVPFRDLIEYLKDAVVTTALIVSAYFISTAAISFATGTNFLTVWLAFVPGGLYEVTLLALIFGFDVAFVAFHHTIRVMMIFVALPLLAFRLGPREVSSRRRLGIDHVNWCTVAPGNHLIKDIGKLDLELVLGHEPDMWRSDQVRMGRQRVVRPADRLLVEHIYGRHAGSPGVQRVEQHALFDQTGARGVHQNRPRLHHRQIGRRDHAAGRGLQPHMQADDIACRKEFLTAGGHDSAIRRRAGTAFLASPDHRLHAERIGVIRDLPSDPAIAEDADLTAMRRFADACLPAAGAKALHLPRNVAQRRQHQRPGHFRRRVRHPA